MLKYKYSFLIIKTRSIQEIITYLTDLCWIAHSHLGGHANLVPFLKCASVDQLGSPQIRLPLLLLPLTLSPKFLRRSLQHNYTSFLQSIFLSQWRFDIHKTTTMSQPIKPPRRTGGPSRYPPTSPSKGSYQRGPTASTTHGLQRGVRPPISPAKKSSFADIIKDRKFEWTVPSQPSRKVSIEDLINESSFSWPSGSAKEEADKNESAQHNLPKVGSIVVRRNRNDGSSSGKLNGWRVILSATEIRLKWSTLYGLDVADMYVR